MTWSYALATLSTVPKDQVRFFLGDTDSGFPQLQDEEINFALSIRTSAYGATALCALALAGKYARQVNMSADGASFQNASRAKAYRDIADEYLQKEAIHYAKPYVAGISISDMRAVLQNTDRVPSIFQYAMFDNPPSDGVSPEQPGGGGEGPPGFVDFPSPLF